MKTLLGDTFKEVFIEEFPFLVQAVVLAAPPSTLVLELVEMVDRDAPTAQLFSLRY